MKIVFTIIFILVLLFLQIGIFPHLGIAGSFPNLIVLAVLGLGILQGWKKTLPWAIASGLFLDFYSFNNFLGFSVIALILITYLAEFLSQNLIKKVNFLSVLLIFLITIFAYYLILLIFFDLRFISLIVGVLYNLVFSLPIFYVLKKIQSKTKV